MPKEYQLWVDVPPDEFRYGETYHLRNYGTEGESTPVREIEHTHYGDYVDGGTIGMANYRTIKEMPELQNKVAYAVGGYGYNTVIVLADREPAQEIINIEGALNDYAILDEEMLNTVEMEREQEGWNDHGRDEFIKKVITPALENIADQLDIAISEDTFEGVIDRLTEPTAADAVFSFYHNIRQHGPGDEVRFEQDGSAYFDFDLMSRIFDRQQFDERLTMIEPILLLTPELIPQIPDDLKPIL